MGFAAYGWPKAEARQVRAELRAAATDAQLPGLAPAALEATVFDGTRPPDPTRDISAARERLERADRQLKRFQLDRAKQNVQAALQTLRPHIGLRAARPTDMKRLFLAVAIAHAERDRRKVQALLNQFVRRYWTVHPVDTPWPPDLRDQLQGTRQRLKMKPLSISTTMAAEASVDGLVVGETPLVIQVPVGRHRVEVRAPQALPEAQTVAVPATSSGPLEVHLTLQANLVDALTAAETLSADLERRIVETARQWGLREVYAVGPEGEDQVRIQRLGTTMAGPVVVDRAPGALRMGLVQIWSSPDDGEPMIWPWVTVGTGAAILGAGIGLHLLAQSTQDDFRDRRHFLTQTEAFELRDQANVEATASTVLISVGAAAIAGGLTWAILEWIEEAP